MDGPRLGHSFTLDTGHRHSCFLCQLGVSGAALVREPQGDTPLWGWLPSCIQSQVLLLQQLPQKSLQTERDGGSHRSLLRTKLFLSASAQPLSAKKPLTWSVLSPEESPPVSAPAEQGLPAGLELCGQSHNGHFVSETESLAVAAIHKEL